MKTPDFTAWRGAMRRLRTRFGRKNALLLAIVGGTVLAAGGLIATGPQPEPVDVAEKSWPVTGLTVSRERLSPELRLFGRVETPHHSTLRSAIGADVQALHVREGQQVEAGQLLVSLDPADEALRLQQAEADLADAEAQLSALHTDFEAERQVLGHMEELYAFTRTKADRLRDPHTCPVWKPKLCTGRDDKSTNPDSLVGTSALASPGGASTQIEVTGGPFPTSAPGFPYVPLM